MKNIFSDKGCFKGTFPDVALPLFYGGHICWNIACDTQQMQIWKSCPRLEGEEGDGGGVVMTEAPFRKPFSRPGVLPVLLQEQLTLSVHDGQLLSNSNFCCLALPQFSPYVFRYPALDS